MGRAQCRAKRPEPPRHRSTTVATSTAACASPAARAEFFALAGMAA
jgi:hypothetical protein